MAWSYRDDNPVESANWFHKTGDYINSHGGRGDDYIRISKDIETELAIKNNPGAAPADLAEHQLFISVRQCSIDVTHSVWNPPPGQPHGANARGRQRLNEPSRLTHQQRRTSLVAFRQTENEQPPQQTYAHTKPPTYKLPWPTKHTAPPGQNGAPIHHTAFGGKNPIKTQTKKTNL